MADIDVEAELQEIKTKIETILTYIAKRKKQKIDALLSTIKKPKASATTTRKPTKTAPAGKLPAKKKYPGLAVTPDMMVDVLEY